MLDHSQVVRYENVGQSQPLLQVLQQVHHLRLHRHVQRRHRLITHNQLRLNRQRARNADALALATGELVRIAQRVLRCQPNSVQQIGHPLALVATAQAVQRQRFHQRLAHRHARVQRRIRVLKDDLHGTPLRAQRHRIQLT